MNTKKTSRLALVLILLFGIGLSCSSSKSIRKCDGKKGQKTRMGTI